MKILLTGSDGFIGCIAAEQLLSDGHEVIGFDTGYYRRDWFFAGLGRTPQTHCRDIRLLKPEDLDDVDAVIHMAELSNDPLGDLDLKNTEEINHHASIRLAKMSREAGVRRFIYMSSCSVYGLSSAGEVDETSPLNPQSVYARCKADVECGLKQLTDASFSPVILRNATAYGVSPRMRLDLVVNNLAAAAWTSGVVQVRSNGMQWRPLVHIRDIVEVIKAVLKRDADDLAGESINVGRRDCNYQIKAVAAAVHREFQGSELTFDGATNDHRSYRVSFDKLRTLLPEAQLTWTLSSGVQELHQVFQQVSLHSEAYTNGAFARIATLQHLLVNGEIDAQFYWMPILEPAP